MVFDPIWQLLALPVAFALGWLASRLDMRQLRLDNRQSPKAYLKGLNYLLNEQQDCAIDAFIEAVQNDPDTSDLHFALGNLFRRRGEYQRAVRVHEHLLARSDLKPTDRDNAQYALALDYLKAGLIEHAETALRKLEGSSLQEQGRQALLGLYERTRDWTHALDVAQKVSETGEQGSLTARMAHFHCELAAEARRRNEAALVLGHFDAARRLAPDAPRPYVDLAAWQRELGELHRAFDTLQQGWEAAPNAQPMLASPLAELAAQTGRIDAVREQISQRYAAAPSLDLLMAMVRLGSAGGADRQALWMQHLEREPSLVAASQWLLSGTQEASTYPKPVRQALDHACAPRLRFRCAACGFETQQHCWHCPGCQSWDSFPMRRVEEW